MLTKKQQQLLLFIHERLQLEGVPPSFDEMKDALGLKSKSGIHRLITALEERSFIRRLPNRARALEVLRLPDGYEARLIGSDEGAGSPAHSSAQAQDMPALMRRGFKPSVIDGGLDDVSANQASTSQQHDNVISPGFGEKVQSAFAGAPENDSATAIPVMGKIAAGVPISAIENRMREAAFPVDMLGSGEHFALEVDGESMIEAGIHDGDTVLIRKTDTANAGEIVVALVDDEEATLKTFRKQGNKIALEAANPEFQTRVFDSSRVKVQGKLVGLIRKYH